MNIGELKHRIILQKLRNVINSNGFESEIYENYKTIWASVSNLYGKEFFEAASFQKENTVKFIIRYLKDIDDSMRVSFKGKQYDITFIDNIKYENKFIEIKALEVDEDG